MDFKQFIRIRLQQDDDRTLGLANELAEVIGLPAPSVTPDPVPFNLVYNNGRLELAENTKNTSNTYVDFLSGSVSYRFHKDRRIKQPLTKAVGIKKGFRPTICDTTAGYGNDAFIFASLGCKVTMIERSPVIWALLQDGLRRASNDETIGHLVTSNLSLYHGNAITLLKDLNNTFDTIFMDPMFPASKKSALNKRKMRILRSLVGEDEDQFELLESALTCARRRIVVKRPAAAPQIGSTTVSYQVKGKSNRYDIYLVSHL